MSLYLTNYVRSSFGSKWHIKGSVQFQGLYPALGELIVPKVVSLSRIESLSIDGLPGGYGYTFNPSTSKLLVYRIPGFGSGAAFTGNVLLPHLHLFTDPYVLQDFPCTFAGVPTGNPLHLAQTGPWVTLQSTIAAAANQWWDNQSGAALWIEHAAIPAGPQLYAQAFDWGGGTTVIRMLADLTGFLLPAPPTSVSLVASGVPGASFEILHDPAAAVNGVICTFNSVAQQLESAFTVGATPWRTRQNLTQSPLDDQGITELETGGTPTGSITGASSVAQPLVEVSAGVDLSAVTNITFEAIGV